MKTSIQHSAPRGIVQPSVVSIRRKPSARFAVAALLAVWFVSSALVARANQIPAITVNGNVSFETSVDAQRKIEVLVIVNAFKP